MNEALALNSFGLTTSGISYVYRRDMHAKFLILIQNLQYNTREWDGEYLYSSTVVHQSMHNIVENERERWILSYCCE
jgi:hypothetical protein